ncbi:phage tail family protein [bacterium]|nr:phage tail family protein [bacterium]
MTRIGGFLFPEKSTHTQCAMVEANSKVRKEIRIRSLLRAPSPQALDERLQQLQAAVEAFDHGDAMVSLQPGQAHYGRRRSFEIAPERRSLAAGVDLLLWTRDRYARSETLHQNQDETYMSEAQFSLFNRGNWKSPLQVSVNAKAKIDSLTIETENESFTINTTIQTGETLVVDSEERTVQINGRNAFASCNQLFPFLQPGANHLWISLAPAGANAQCVIAFRDVWV